MVLASLRVGVGWQLYQKLTNNTVVAYFPATNALYAGDKVVIMGIRVGAIDKIEPTGDRMKVTFHYRNKFKVPANATASILNPTPGGLAEHPAVSRPTPVGRCWPTTR